MSRDLTYESYLQLERVLGAQGVTDPSGRPREYGHRDELLFIVIHQVYELWFKQVLHELQHARDVLAQGRVPEHHVPRAVKSLMRVHEIEKVMVQQLSVLETMHPVDFLAFRSQLGSASGFQSAQFRKMEILAGLPDDMRYAYQGESFERRFGDDDVAAFDAMRGEPSLRDALYRWLGRTPLEDGFVESYLEAFGRYVDSQRELQRGNAQLSEDERARVLAAFDAYEAGCREWLSGDEADARAACLFITAFREEPLLHWPNRLLDALLEFEELLRLWRFRHARMVERMIGLRVGTGGSSGVTYLDKTAGSRYRIFTVILESRSFLVPRSLLPELRDPGRYGFARG